MRVIRIIAAIAAFCLSGAATAQAYPAKPVRFVVAFAPGGIADVAARLIAARLGDAWGQPVVVENRAGAGGNVGTTTVARSAADAYTVLVTTTSVAVNPSLSANAGYDLEKDLVAVINIASSPNLIVAFPGLGAANLQQAIAKARAGKLNYGSAGAGTTPHLTAEHLFKTLAKVNVAHIPYKGAGPAIAAAVAGEVEMASVAMPPAVPLVKAGKLTGLAVTSNKRVAALPEVPTVAESGFPGFEDYTWVGLFMPAGSPADAVARLNAEVEKLIALSDVKERLAALGFETVGGSPQNFARYLKTELSRWAEVVRATGAKVD